MFNPIPFVALGAIALGYSVAIEKADAAFDAAPAPVVASFAAAPGLSVHNFIGRLPETVQDPLCDAHDAVTASLTEDFEEVLETSWTQEPTITVELWTSDLMGTWTLLTVGGDDMACIVSSGFGWSEGMDAESILQDRPIS